MRSTGPRWRDARRSWSTPKVAADKGGDFDLSFPPARTRSRAAHQRLRQHRQRPRGKPEGGLASCASANSRVAAFWRRRPRRPPSSPCRTCAARTLPASCRWASGIIGSPAPTTPPTALVQRMGGQGEGRGLDRLHHLAGQQEPAHHRRRGAGPIGPRHIRTFRAGSRPTTPTASSRSTTSWRS